MTKIRFISFGLLLTVSMTTVVFNSCSKTDASRQDNGVVINGVKWATRNVDAPGTFAAHPEDLGMFYQWNRKKAWSATGDVTGWVNYDSIAYSWEKSNDPSPKGWRVPTLEEIKTLFDANKVSNEWTTENGINGRKFVDKATGKTLFLPAAGYRHINCGTLCDIGSRGSYWSSSEFPIGRGGNAYALFFVSDSAIWYNGFGGTFGSSVRVVAE